MRSGAALTRALASSATSCQSGGPDSDDFYIFIGLKHGNWEIIPSFNYERHGVQEPMIETEYEYERNDLNNYWPEVKTEFRFDIRYLMNDL